jgi:hypothetical protein
MLLTIAIYVLSPAIATIAGVAIYMYFKDHNPPLQHRSRTPLQNRRILPTTEVKTTRAGPLLQVRSCPFPNILKGC